MSPSDEIMQEVDSLEEATNEAIQTLSEVVNLNVSIVEEHSGKLEHLDERVGKLEDMGETIDSLEKAIGDLTRRLKALEAPAPVLKRLHELEAEARKLGPTWVEVEIYERPDGMLQLDRFLGQRSVIEERVAKNAQTLAQTKATC